MSDPGAADVRNLQPLRDALISLDQGWSPKCSDAASDDAETWAVIKTTAIQPGRFVAGENKVLPPALAPRPALQIESGDILITRAGPRSRVGIACFVPTCRTRLLLCDKAYRLRVHPQVADAAYVGLMLNAPPLLAAIEELKSGISDSGLNLTQDRFLSLQIPVPPLAEQRRIVARIEVLFARTRQARADLLRVASLAERHMSAALAAAFRGELLSSPGGDTMPPPLVPLTTVVESLRYGTAQKCSPEPRGIAVLRIPNVANGRIDLDDLKYGVLDRAELERLRLRVGDILIIRSNGSPTLVGRPALIGQEAEGLAFAGYLIRARPRSDRVVPAYLSLMLQAPQIRDRIEINARSSSGVHNINSEELGALEVPLPSIDQQRLTVERLNAERAQAERLAREATRSLALLDHLERSILTRAFRGELVPQDLADEPTAVTIVQPRNPATEPGRRRLRRTA